MKTVHVAVAAAACSMALISANTRAQTAAQEGQEGEEPKVEAAPLETVTVTGSLLPTAPDAVAVPIIALDAKQLEQNGVTTNALEILRKATPSFAGRSNAGTRNANNDNQRTAGGLQLQLRNLPTLILVNGRRVANSGVGGINGKNFVDVNQIPAAAIDHIEVLTDGASSIYGSDAIGVVVNFILKSNYKSIKMDGPTDAIIFEPRNHLVYVTHDEGANVWVIDPVAAKVIASIEVPGVPEFMVYDESTDRIYLNIKSADRVAVIDPGTQKTVAQWPTAPATQPHGLALDAANHRIFSSGANGKLVVIDTGTGKVTGTAEIAPKVDQIAFDPAHHVLYCAGPERMSIVRTSGDSVAAAGELKTAATAKNVAVDPQTGSVWTTYTDGKSSFAKSWASSK